LAPEKAAQAAEDTGAENTAAEPVSPLLPLSVRAHPAVGQTQPDRRAPRRPENPKAEAAGDAATAFLNLETAFAEES
ncbi:MAG: hypothetical protein AB3N24_08340, partial [Leisingera sp.]